MAAITQNVTDGTAQTVKTPSDENTPRYEQEKTIFSWKAPARSFKPRNREYWITLGAIAATFGLILFIIEGIMPVLLIVALFFLYYVLSTVEPEEIDYHITNKGVKIADRRTEWELLTRFWFIRRGGDEMVVFESVNLPGRIELVIHSQDKEKLMKSVTPYLPHEEAPPTHIDKAADWFSSKLPGNQ